jgi:hypothetical protein
MTHHATPSWQGPAGVALPFGWTRSPELDNDVSREQGERHGDLQARRDDRRGPRNDGRGADRHLSPLAPAMGAL